MRVGITGQVGFVGSHLYNTLGLDKNIERIPFFDSYFDDMSLLRDFVKQCDVIVHLAAINRHPNLDVLYNTNILLVNNLIEAMTLEKVTPHILFSSSTQEEKDNLYGKSKKVGRELFGAWAEKTGGTFTGLIIPNVFGPFSKPNYNTFVATFAHKIIIGEQPKIDIDRSIKLIYISSLCNFIIASINNTPKGSVKRIEIPHDFEKNVSDIFSLFDYFNNTYLKNGFIPVIKDINEINLFNTFRSYLDYTTHFPITLKRNSDKRGLFVEVIRTGIGGQVSFSTSVPGTTRGNHYHTRKIERFTVIRGKAKIQLRKIGTSEVIDYYLDGNQPSYVDMPVWYTHNITNIGEDELYTQFWINEWYNPEDGDTYFEEV